MKLTCHGWVFVFQALVAVTHVHAQSPARQPSAQWKLHESAALEALGQADSCIAKSFQSLNTVARCNSTELLAKAASEYNQLVPLVAEGKTGAEDAAIVADGLSRSGAFAQAIQFLMGRSDVATDANLSHLLADALFNIGDYKTAAMAYRNWIATGCVGYMNSMHDPWPWIVKIKADRCAQLPIPLRSRLELLQQFADGEPENLPEHNEPPGMMSAR